jgi:D-threonate/D-erythronate kinase
LLFNSDALTFASLNAQVKIAIIADDLTSAADAGVQFTRAGYSVKVTFYDCLQCGTTADVVSVDTDSRSQLVADAKERTRDTARALKNASLLYKTMDSTLRGHVGPELSALLAETGHDTAIVAPAFPYCGRTTENGVQLLNGRFVHETEFAVDPANPVISSQIESLLDDPELLPVVRLSREDVQNHSVVRSSIASARCVVADSATQDDLRALVQGVEDLSSVCWVGSPGLAGALAERLPPFTPQSDERAPACDRVLTVVGSLNPVSRVQLRRLLSRDDAVGLNVDVSRGDDDRVSVDRIIAEIQRHFGSKRIVVLSSPERRVPTAGACENKDGLAAVASLAITERVADGLVVTGGATAVAVLRRAEITELSLHGELAAGIPIAKSAGPDGIWIVTKAGGFGSENALFESCSALLSGSSGSHAR